MPQLTGRTSAGRRLVWSSVTAVVLVAATIALPSSSGEGAGSFRSVGAGISAAGATERAGGVSTGDPAGHDLDDGQADGHAHDHGDPTTKNALSRGGELSSEAVDATTAREARANTAYVARDRQAPAPRLRRKSLTSSRQPVPEDRFAMASGCYTLQGPDGPYVRRDGTGLAATAGSRSGAKRFHFRATDLGTYLLFGPRGDFVAGASGQVTMAARPARSTEWTAQRSGQRFTFRLPGGRGLAVSSGKLRLGPPTAFALRTASGCRSYPEVQVNVAGAPHGGATSFQEVRGYVDPHTHGMAFEFLGGRVHCGRPWHPYGAAYALVDCPDHSLTAGKGALLEAALSGQTSHDPVGWPTFKDWPAPNSLTHEGTYYKWMERSWRGGLRIFTNLLVENGQLCRIYPLKKNSCDDMTSIRLQAQRMREFERYVDAQHGGPGEGWYRIVRSPWQARKVINQGKLAVIMGIETSVPFGCTFKACRSSATSRHAP